MSNIAATDFPLRPRYRVRLQDRRRDPVGMRDISLWLDCNAKSADRRHVLSM
jgi:hypothetical protein